MKRLINQTLFLAVALFSVQGTIYLYQLLGASVLTAEHYSSIRVIESVGALASLIITFGVPSIVLVRVGVLDDAVERRKFLEACMLLLAGFFLIFCIVFFAATSGGYLSADIAAASYYVVCLAFAMALRLFLSSVLQSDLKLVHLAGSAITACCASYVVGAVLFFSGVNALVSWLLARLTMEIVNCILMAISGLHRTSPPMELGPTADRALFKSSFSLARTVFPIGASLGLRSIIENGPIILLSTAGFSAMVIAQVGLATTMVGIALFPAAIVQTVLIPRIAGHLKRNEDFGYAAIALLGGAILSLSTLLVIAGVAGLQQQWIAFLSWRIVTILSVILIAKLLAGACGALLLLFGRGSAIMLLNGVTLVWGATVAGILRWAFDGVDAGGILLAILAMEGLAMCTYVATAAVVMARRSAPRGP